MDHDPSATSSEINSPPMAERRPEKKEKTKYVYKPKEKVWTPDVDYAKTLGDIKNQRTPAELYRYKLETIGRHARDMQRLEWRWSRNIPLWTRSSSIVKAGWRGMKSRIYFKSVKADLVIQKERREIKQKALLLYKDGKLIEAADAISSMQSLNSELQFMKCQFFYMLRMFEECIQSSEVGLAMLETPQQGPQRYIMACSMAKLGRWEDAYVELSKLIVLCDPLHDAYKLRGYIGFHKLSPPRYEQSLLDMFHLLQIYPNDLDIVLQRACIYIGLQDWDHAIEDFDYILYYQPELDQVLAMRARAYSCRREWSKAIADYQNILSRNPEDPVALTGLTEVNPPYEDLPMLDKSVVDS